MKISSDVARFEPEKGGMITSETSMQRLPGISPETDYEGQPSPKGYSKPSEIDQGSSISSSSPVEARLPSLKSRGDVNVRDN